MLFAYSIYGQTNSRFESELDRVFTNHFNPVEPGCEVIITKQGKVLYNKSFGSANLELNVPIRPEMVFNLASITKQFTAVAILKLVEEEKISLKDSLQQYIPEYPSKNHLITIENLLTHTSGIKDYMQIDYGKPYMERWDFTPKEIIDLFKVYPLEFTPGTKFSYSNSGYFLLGYIIEKVSGQTYQNYIKENILTPLHLNHTYYDTKDIIVPNRVNGYYKEGDGYINAEYWSPTIAYSAGGLLSNAKDLWKWFDALLNYNLIKKETLAKAFTPFILTDGSTTNYGYGWHIFNSSSGIKSIEHGGKMTGFITNQIYYPGQDIFIAILCNSENASRDEISKKVSEIVLGETLQQEMIVAESSLAGYEGTYSLSTDRKRIIEIVAKDDRLLAKVSGQDTFEITFQTATKFQFKDIKDMTAEFIWEQGTITKIVVNQNGKFEWKKIK